MRRTGLAIAAVLWLTSTVAAAGVEHPATFALSGTVRTTDGKPVSGAAVVLMCRVFRETGSWPQEERRAVTDAEGRFALEAPRLFATERLDVEPPAGSPLKLWSVDPPALLDEIGRGRPAAEVTLALRPARGVITGKVLADPPEEPVPGARVKLVRLAWFPGCPPRQNMKAVTDARGVARFEGLLPGFYCFETISPPDGSNLSGQRFGSYSYNPRFRPVRLTPGAELDRTFRLRRGLRMNGRVVDEDGGPVAGATVRAHRGSASAKGLIVKDSLGIMSLRDETTTGANGRYTLEGLSPETYQVQVTPPVGSALAHSHPMMGLDLTADRTLADIVLVRGGTLEGVVKGPDGKPIAGATVMLNSQTASRLLTDATGRYRYAGLRTGCYRLRVEPPEGSKWMPLKRNGVQALAKVRRAHDLDLVEGCAVEGKIADAKGRAAPGVAVRFGHKVVARTGDDGRYRVQGLAGENHIYHGFRKADVYLSFEPPARSDLLPLRSKLSLTRAETRTHDVTLKIGGTLSGQVKTAEGRPVAYARVRVYTADERGRPRKHHGRTDPSERPGVLTDHRGCFAVRGVPDEPVTVLVLPPPESGAAWLAKPYVRVSTDAVQLLELTAEEGAVLTGVLRDRDGKPAPDMTVMLRTKETPHRSKPLVRITDVSGAYRFKGLKPGRYSISVPWFYKRSARVLANLRTVHVQAGETVTCDLVMTGRP